MALKKILLDSNTYLRLAYSIRPLLGQPFGDSKYSLYLYKVIKDELNKSSRIRNKFHWVDQNEYVKERNKVINCSKQNKLDIEDTYDHIWQYQDENNFGLSREDIYCIAAANVVKLKMVTDEVNMIRTAKEFEVDVINTLELLKLMFENEHIDKDKLKEITEYWKYINDLPTNFYRDKKRLFKGIL